MGKESSWLEEAEDVTERGDPVRWDAEERRMEIRGGTEDGHGLVSRDDGRPREHGIAEVPHDQDATTLFVVPGVDHGVPDARRQPVEQTPLEEVHLAAVVVSGQAHHQIDGRVEPLDHDARAVGEEHAFQRRPGAAVVVHRGSVDCAVEQRAVHVPIVPAGRPFRSPVARGCYGSGTSPAPESGACQTIVCSWSSDDRATALL